MAIYIPPPRWLEMPELIVWERFDCEEGDGAVSTAGQPVFQGPYNRSWRMQAGVANGTAARVATPTNHDGLWSFGTGATSGNSVFYGHTCGAAFSGSGGFNTSSIVYHQKVISVASTTSIDQHYGLAGNIGSLANQFVLLSHASSVGGNWIAQTQTPAVASTVVNTGVPVTAGYHVLGFEHVFQPTELWNFYLDGVLINTISTNLPGGLLCPGGLCITRTSATRNMLIDDEKLWVHGSLRLAS